MVKVNDVTFEAEPTLLEQLARKVDDALFILNSPNVKKLQKYI